MEQKELSKHVAKINRILEKDYDHETPDVIRSKKFNIAFTELIDKMFPNCTVITSLGGYCMASGFIKKHDKYVYYSTEDYRFPSDSSWKNNILYRTAENDRDYRGGSNHYADIEYLQECVEKLLNI